MGAQEAKNTNKLHKEKERSPKKGGCSYTWLTLRHRPRHLRPPHAAPYEHAHLPSSSSLLLLVQSRRRRRIARARRRFAPEGHERLILPVPEIPGSIKQRQYHALTDSWNIA